MDRTIEAKQDLYARFWAQLEKFELTVDDVPFACTSLNNEFWTELGFTTVDIVRIKSCLSGGYWFAGDVPAPKRARTASAEDQTTSLSPARFSCHSAEQVGRPSSWRRLTDEEWTARRDRGNIEMECGVCNEQSTMQALVPCGHLVCQSCSSKPEVTKKCPFCKQPAIGTQVLFKP